MTRTMVVWVLVLLLSPGPIVSYAFGYDEMFFLVCCVVGLLALVLRERRIAYTFLAPACLWVATCALQIGRMNIHRDLTVDPLPLLQSLTMMCSSVGLVLASVAVMSAALIAMLVLWYKAMFSHTAEI